ncbi:MAG TPA: universal stress protein [Candidatus Limnocylindrales bacterium]|nr:universal stress protein [Candidatus Limnocylindrales bacterium]
MYRSILVPLDGSTLAEQALPIARGIVSRIGAGAKLQLVLVHVPTPARYADGVLIFDETLETQVREHEHNYLNNVIKKLALGPEVSVTAEVLSGRIGKVDEILHDHIVNTGVNLVVMATHGHGPLARFWLGSVTDKLIRQSVKPILLVPVREKTEETPDLTREEIFQHILIPLDGSAFSEQILEHVVGLGKLMEADYTLLQVVEPVVQVGYSINEEIIRLNQILREHIQTEAQKYLDSVAERLRVWSLQVQTRVIIDRHPATAILEEASRQGIDLIAMETHGRGGLTRLLIGSVADKVLRGTSIPVLLHRPRSEP